MENAGIRKPFKVILLLLTSAENLAEICYSGHTVQSKLILVLLNLNVVLLTIIKNCTST